MSVRQRIAIPAGTPPGRYRMVAGLWDPGPAARLHVWWRGLVPTLETALRGLYRRLTETHELSARGAKRMLRVARTLADLEGKESIAAPHLNEAASFRLGTAAELA